MEVYSGGLLLNLNQSPFLEVWQAIVVFSQTGL